MSARAAQIAASFSRAASSYDAAAVLQREVGEQLWQCCQLAAHRCAVDIGCGTGFMTRKLQGVSQRVIAVDIAEGMLRTVQAQRLLHVSAVQGNMVSLPLADRSADLLLSNLALQWVSDLAATFAEWRRVLCADGTLAFSTFLPGTLQELHDSWRAVDNAVHVNRFDARETLLDALQSAGFVVAQTRQQSHVRHYDSVQALSRELKAIGAHNINAGRIDGLAGRRRWQLLQQQYEQFRRVEGLPATYEVFYVVAH